MHLENYFENKRHADGRTIKTRGVPFDKSRSVRISPGFYSVVIPTYNREQGLERVLISIANQTLDQKMYEIIIVDDGSTDGTPQKVSEIQKIFPDHNIRYLHRQNGGPAKARNTGIREARGEIIFFTDDDCIVPRDWMQTLLDGLNRYPEAAGVGGWYAPPLIDLKKSGGSRYMHMVSYRPHLVVGTYIKNHEISSNDPLVCFGTFAYNTANVCYRKEILEKVGGFREDFYWPGSEDNDLAFRIALTGHYLLYLPFHVIHCKPLGIFDFAKLHFHRGANGCLFRKLNRQALDELKPGFAEQYGSVASFASRLMGPDKLWAWLEWASVNAGIIYMEQKLKKGIVAPETRV